MDNWCSRPPHTPEPEAARDPERQLRGEDSDLRGRGEDQGSLPRSRAGRVPYIVRTVGPGGGGICSRQCLIDDDCILE